MSVIYSGSKWVKNLSMKQRMCRIIFIFNSWNEILFIVQTD